VFGTPRIGVGQLAKGLGLKMGKFRDLKVWQKGKDLAVLVYQITSRGEFSKDFGLRDQMRRAAVSISSNIAEGELDTDSQSVRHFFIAKGSAAEVSTQAEIACAIGYLSSKKLRGLEAECAAIAGMLTR
jgi:four helix bundle protein